MHRRAPLRRTPLRPGGGGLRRTPLRGGAPLARGRARDGNTSIRRRSPRKRTLYDERRDFVRRELARRPRCEVGYEGCTGQSQDVHEVIARGRGGAIIPGLKADAQGQRWLSICRQCHEIVTIDSARARRDGFVK